MHDFVIVCGVDELLIPYPTDMEVFPAELIDSVAVMYFVFVPTIHNSTTLPLVVVGSIVNTTNAVLSSIMYPPFDDNALLPFVEAENTLAIVNTPLVTLLVSMISTLSRTLPPNVELSARSSVDTDSDTVAAIVVVGDNVDVVGSSVVVSSTVVVGVCVVVGAVVGEVVGACVVGPTVVEDVVGVGVILVVGASVVVTIVVGTTVVVGIIVVVGERVVVGVIIVVGSTVDVGMVVVVGALVGVSVVLEGGTDVVGVLVVVGDTVVGSIVVIGDRVVGETVVEGTPVVLGGTVVNNEVLVSS
jgi:hypothetical protein